VQQQDVHVANADKSPAGLASVQARIGRLLSLGLVAAGLGAVTVPPERPDEDVTVRHITLDASSPEDEQTVDGEVTEVRLFFSDAPLMRGASIRIVDASRKLVRSSPPEADADDPKQLSVQVAPALPAGKYVVQWRCIADDGHVMRGDFTFEVAPH
jgi:methionine-rich copper-binding protein CopC